MEHWIVTALVVFAVVALGLFAGCHHLCFGSRRSVQRSEPASASHPEPEAAADDAADDAARTPSNSA